MDGDRHVDQLRLVYPRKGGPTDKEGPCAEGSYAEVWYQAEYFQTQV